MACFHPLTIRNPAWVNGDTTATRYVTVPCGKCVGCKEREKLEWMTRLQFESRCCETPFFVTLTYSPENLPFDEYGNPCVSKRDCQLFLRRLKDICKPLGASIRYFLCSEYGSNFLRPHYHMVLFGFPSTLLNVQHILFRCWDKGFVDVGLLKDGGASYVCKYIVNSSEVPDYLVPCFRLMSKRPGLGSNFLTNSQISYLNDNKLSYLPTSKDSSFVLGRYLRSRSLSEETLSFLHDKYLDDLAETHRKDFIASSKLHSVGPSPIGRQNEQRERKMKQNNYLNYKKSKL